MASNASIPGLKQHGKATRTDFPGVVEDLERIIGRRLTAYIASIKDARALDRWVDGKPTSGDTESRLRLAFQIASMIGGVDSPAVVRAWLTGLNPLLDDQVPSRLLRDGELEKDGKRVLAAARAFVVQG